MLQKVSVLIFVALVLASVAEQDIPGKQVKAQRAFALFDGSILTCDPTGHYVQCDSCSSYMVCLGGLQTNRACPANKPYCNNNECSTTPDYSSCPVPSLNCTGVGFYPDPKTCQFYHYCEASSRMSDVYECPQNYFFNTQNSLCRRDGKEALCDIIDCDPRKILQSYKSNKRYFAFCRDQDILMAKCDYNHVFTETGCVFQCPREGLFPHTDKTKYYSCYYSGTKLVKQQMSCPPNRVFVDYKGVCLTESAK